MRCTGWIACLLILGAWGVGCSGPGQHPSLALLDQLRAPAPERRDSAREALNSFLFLEDDLPLLYESLKEPYPEDSATRSALLALLRDLHESPQTEQFIDQAYPVWPQALQPQALITLAHIGTPLASQVLLDRLEQQPALVMAQLNEIFAPYYRSPEQVGPLFPGLLRLRSQPGYGRYVFGLLRAGLEAGSLMAQDLQGHLPLLITAQRKPYDQEAQVHLLHALSFFAAQPEVNQLLLRSMERGAPHEQLAATLACLDRSIRVGDSTLTSVAAEPLVRNELLLGLRERGLGQRFPPAWRNQKALAEGDLAAWLDQREIDFRRMEHLETYRLKLQEETLWVFRYQSEGYWRLGVSGPQPADSSQVRAAGYLTGSDGKRFFGYGQAKRVQEWLATQGAGDLTLGGAAIE